jgi:thiamine biosynthesis lipoprotein
LTLSLRTQGAFDVTIGAATRAWRAGQPATPVPRYREVALGQGTVTLTGEGIAFDFGGIAKGYAADEALRVLKQRGFPRAMASLSGDIAVGAPPAGARGWRIGLGSAARVEELAHRGISTSGDSRQARRGESHVFDARRPAARAARAGAVTVIAPTAMEADALATAIFAMGKEEAEKRLLPMADIRVVFHDF